MCEGMEGWRGGAASDDSAPPLRLQKSLIISIYPPQIPVGLAEASFPLYPPQWRNYPNPAISHPNCKTAHLDNTQPPTFFFRISSPCISAEQGKIKKKKKQEKIGVRMSTRDVGKGDETWDVFHAMARRIFVYKRQFSLNGAAGAEIWRVRNFSR